MAHCGTIGDEYSPIRRGFDEFVGFWGGWQDYWDWQLERNGEALHSDGRYLTHVITDEAVDFIRRSEGGAGPSSCTSPTTHPTTRSRHPRRRSNVTCGPDALSGSRPLRDDRGDGSGRRGHPSAAGDPGQFLADDRAVHQRQRTGTGRRGRSCDRFNAGLSGEKCLVWRAGSGFRSSLPGRGRLPAGAEHDTFVHGTDLLPTLIDLAGLNRTGALPLDGRSIAPYLHEPDAEPPAPISGSGADISPSASPTRRHGKETGSWSVPPSPVSST